MTPYVSTIFKTPQEFEEWIKNTKNTLTGEKVNEWNSKGCLLDVKNGKLQLLSLNRDVLAEVEMDNGDGVTLVRDEETGAITVKGIKDNNYGSVYDLWVGSKAAFNALSIKKTDTIYVIEDDDTLEEIYSRLAELEAWKTSTDELVKGLGEAVIFLDEWHDKLLSGEVKIKSAESADYAENAGTAQNAYKDNLGNNIRNKYLYLGGAGDNGAYKIMNKSFDINTLNTAESCGMYIFHFAALQAGGGKNFPKDLDVNEVTAAILTVEADLEQTSGYCSIYHTLKVSVYEKGHDKLQIYYRVFHNANDTGWDEWKRFISAAEVEQKLEEVKLRDTNGIIVDDENKTIDMQIGSIVTVADTTEKEINNNLYIGDVIDFNDERVLVTWRSAETKPMSGRICEILKWSGSGGLYKLLGTWVLCGEAGQYRGNSGINVFIARRIS